MITTPNSVSPLSNSIFASSWSIKVVLTTIVLTIIFFLTGLRSTYACHDTSIDNVVTIDNGNGTYTYTINLHVEVGSFDGYGYGFALLFQNSTPIQPMVLTNPGFTPTVTRPGYDPLIGYTGANIGSGPVPFFGQRYGNSANVLTYETTDDWWGFGSTPYDAVITVTVSGCIESISLDGDFRSMGSANGDLACMDVYSTGLTCCQGGPLTGNVNETICPGETFVYNGTTYDENNTSGTHFVSNSQGCDSTVVVTIIIDQNCCDPQTTPIVGPTSLCQNATGNVYSVDFTAGSTYAWNVPAGATITSGQGTNSVIVNFGSSGGQITVIETEPCGVAPEQSLTIVLDPLQNLSITNPTIVCAPSTVDLTVTSVTSGSSGGGALTYWTNASGTSSLSNPTAVSSSGTYYIQAGTGACSDIQPVVVTIETPQTSTISGPTPLCQNATGNVYSVVNTPGSTYTWSVPTGATIASGQGTNSITVDFGMTGGQVSVIETLSCGDGPQVSYNVSLDPTQNLVISNPAGVCAPNTVDLTTSAITSGSSGGGALTYWTNASATTALQNPNSVSVPGTYYIQAGTGVCSDIQPVIVSVGTPQTSAISGPSSLCENTSGSVFSVVNTSGSTYTWTVPAGATITSGQGTNSITVDFGTNAGQVSVFETLACGDGQPVGLSVSLDPVQSLIITDPTSVCAPNTIDLTSNSITAGSSGGNLTYWTDANANSALTNPASVAVSGTYYIQAGNGPCADIQPVNVAIDICASCTMTSLNLDMTDCYTSGQGILQYDLQGTLTYSDAPATGTLTITDCNGNAQIFNPPFNGTQTFTVSGLPQDGLACDFTAEFSDDPNCTITTGFTAPPAITAFEANCISGAGEVNGTVEFDNPPTGGSFVVEISDGANTLSTNVQPPFNSPESWTVSGLDPAAANYVITYYFSDFASCAQSYSIICGCSAVGGTTQAFISGNGTTNFVLCEGDQLDISSNNDFTFPADQGLFDDPNGIQYPYQPGYAYMVYACTPTPGVFPLNDPCFLGFAGDEGSLTDMNGPSSIFAQYPAGTFTNNQVFYVPATLYHFDPVAPAYVFNSNCWALGTVTTATYLTPIETSETADCQLGTVTVNVSGGHPAVLGGTFSASNLVPATANFVNSTVGNNGTIVIEGLQNGDLYSFDIEDENGCPITISGGPFVGVPVSDAGPDAQTCILEYPMAAVSNSTSGAWSGGPAGTVFLPDENQPDALVIVPNSGTFIFTWTEDNGNGCLSTDNIEITFSSMSIPAVITNASCGSDDGQITVAPQGGTGPFSYAWTSGGSGVTESNLAAGPVTVTVTDDTGCSLDSIFSVSQPTTFNVTINASDANCFGVCDGQIEILPDGSGPYDYAWTPNVSTGNSNDSLCPGSYEVLVSDQAGCTQTVTASIAEPAKIDVVVSSDKSEVCLGGIANLNSTVSGGAQPYYYSWTASPLDPDLDSIDPNPQVSPTVTTVYTLVVTDSNGCQSLPALLTIDVLAPLNLSGNDASICPNEEATIDLMPSGGDGYYSIFLLPNQVDPVSMPMTIQTSSTSTYEFMVLDGCESPAAFSTSTVTVHELPQIMLDANPKVGCAPLTVNFADLTQPNPQGWTWDFGDIVSESNSAQIESPKHTYEDDGLYDVSLSITTDEGCFVDTLLENYIEVYPNPTADFEMSDDLVSLLKADVEFTDQSEGNITNWYWDFGDGEESNNQNPDHRYEQVGIYNVVLEVVSIHGCTAEASQFVEVEPSFTFYVPNAFSPNNDQHNNIFKGVGEGIDPDNFQMNITNRWGELIYHTGNIEEGWDGTFKGLPVELAAYVYEISLFDLTGDDHYFRGHVTLVR